MPSAIAGCNHGIMHWYLQNVLCVNCKFCQLAFKNESANVVACLAAGSNSEWLLAA